LRTHRTLSLLLFLATLTVSTVSILTHEQLGLVAGMVDEWFLMGSSLWIFQTLGIGPDRAEVMRPPGYPAFIAAVVALVVPRDASTFTRHIPIALSVLYLAQAVVLAATASALFLWLRTRLRPAIALAMAAAFGLNPYCVVLVGITHYDILHMFGLVVCGWALDRATSGPTVRARDLVGPAVLFGLCTLVRPITLLFPPFVLLLLLWRRRPFAESVRAALVFGLCMAAVVMPWTARNFAVTGRLIPVNAQAWFTMSGSTVRAFPVDPDHVLWGELHAEHIMPVFTRVSGETELTIPARLRFALALEPAFREQALRNMREKPQVYLHNVARGLWTMAVDVNAVLIRMFEHEQRPGVHVSQDWFAAGHPQDFPHSGASTGFRWLFRALTVLALGGAAVRLARRDHAVDVPALLLLVVMTAHAITYMDFFYYYVKLPFIFALAGFGLDSLPQRMAVGGREVGVGEATGMVMAVASAVLTAMMLGS
jgi:hypothetical protein